MNEYTISVSKCLQELRYEPFTFSISKKFNAESLKEVADEELKLERFVDKIIERRDNYVQAEYKKQKSESVKENE